MQPTQSTRRGAWQGLLVLLVVLEASSQGALRAQSLTLELRDTIQLAGTTTDQHGASFAVTGLSGVCSLGGDDYICVLDNSDKLVRLELVLDVSGSIASVTTTGGLQLALAGDFEGIASPGVGSDRVLIAEEGAPGVFEFQLSDGALLGSFPIPAVFSNIRNNRGFESMTHHCTSQEVWTANEEALTVDGSEATPQQGSTVRLLRFDASGQATQQYAYEVEAMHGNDIPGGQGRSGLSELLMLPDGTLLALERSLALANPLYLSRIYRVDFSAATDVSSFPALAAASFNPVSKELLWSGSLANLEGLTLGPRLGSQSRALIGVVDDGDPLSSNTLVTFELSGLALDECECGASSYCAPTPNSVGLGALITSAGSTSLGSNDLCLKVTGAVPGSSGLFYYGSEAVNLPFGEGARCVGAGTTGIFRLGPPGAADGLGGVTRPLDYTAAPMNGGLGLVAAGSTWYFQYWYRDPLGGPSGFNLSDGLEVSFCP